MKSDFVIKAEAVSKKFTSNLRRSMLYGLSDVAHDILGLSTNSEQLRKNEFWAVNDVSFEVKKGARLGIVGPNGSGKSTMLKMLNGIISPDRGKLSIRGRVGALIEVGAGFHPMLTGRENIFINGAILGMSKAEIKSKLDSIVNFAEISDFLDMPVKNYSSGMYVRLGFAIAAHCEPEVLLIDEILSVGDISFQRKCFEYLEKNIINKDVTLCLVSHSIYTISRLCHDALILNKGNIAFYGDAGSAVSHFYKIMTSTRSSQLNGLGGISSKLLSHEGVGEIRVRGIEIRNALSKAATEVISGESVEFHFELSVAREFRYFPQVHFKITDLSGTVVVNTMMRPDEREKAVPKKGTSGLVCKFVDFNIMPGKYLLHIKIGGGDDLVQDNIPDAMSFEVTGGSDLYQSTGGVGICYLNNSWRSI